MGPAGARKKHRARSWPASYEVEIEGAPKVDQSQSAQAALASLKRRRERLRRHSPTPTLSFRRGTRWTSTVFIQPNRTLIHAPVINDAARTRNTDKSKESFQASKATRLSHGTGWGKEKQGNERRRERERRSHEPMQVWNGLLSLANWTNERGGLEKCYMNPAGG